MNEIRTAKVLVYHPGGNASKGALGAKITLPIKWVRDMNITLDDREVYISYDGEKIVIEKK